MIYALTYACPNINDVKVFKTENPREWLTAWIQKLPETRMALIVESEDDLKSSSGPLLVKLHNEMNPATGPVTKFSDLATARRRVFTLVRDRATTAEDASPVAEIPVLEEKEADVAKKTKTPRKSKYSENDKIEVLVDENPRREGTKAHKAFALYRSGMKVGTFLANGGTRTDLSWDVRDKHVKIIKAD